MAWKVIHTRSEDEWFSEYLSAVLTSRPPARLPRIQRVGTVDTSWFETEPGIVFINAVGGNSPDDRRFARLFVTNQLKAHGFKLAQYDIDTPFFEKRAAWSDIMEKAQRLRGNGQVQLLRNGYDVVVGQVQGDHGTYQTEIAREDPNSRSITQWQCECPWDQYAWQRTRQWKKYEGRPCAHVLATFWESQRTPLDEDIHPAQQAQPGAGAPVGMPGAQMNLFNMAPGPAPAPGGTPMMPPQGTMAPPGMYPQPPIPGAVPMTAQGVPVNDPGLIPPFPGAPPPEPIDPHTLPVSVPGGYPPTPHNPVQYPGGTFSSVEGWHLAKLTDKQLMDLSQGLESDLGPDQSQVVHSYPNGWTMRKLQTYADAHREGKLVSNCFAHDSHTPHSVWALHPEASHWDADGDGYAEEYAIPTVSQFDLPLPIDLYSLRDPNNIPHVSVDPSGMEGSQALGRHNSNPKPEYRDMLAQWNQRISSEGWKLSAQGFQNGDMAQLLVPEVGIAEGKSEAHGSGQWRDIGKGQVGEVMGQDATTGWVEVIFPLHDTGPMEPYHVRMFVEPEKLRARPDVRKPGPFIQRRK